MLGKLSMIRILIPNYTSSPLEHHQTFFISIQFKKRFKKFLQKIQKIFRKYRDKTNLLLYQSRTLRWFQLYKNILVIVCDKNLGPVVINVTTYIHRALTDHFLNEKIYRRLSAGQATIYIVFVKDSFFQ